MADQVITLLNQSEAGTFVVPAGSYINTIFVNGVGAGNVEIPDPEYVAPDLEEGEEAPEVPTITVYDPRIPDGGVSFGTVWAGVDIVGQSGTAERVPVNIPVFSFSQDTTVYFDCLRGWQDKAVDIRIVVKSLVG